MNESDTDIRQENFGFRLVVSNGTAKLFAAAGVSGTVDMMFNRESGRTGATVYEFGSYADLTAALAHTEGLAGVKTIDMASPRGYYVAYRPGEHDGRFPHEPAVRNVLEGDAPSVPGWIPSTEKSVTILQDEKTPEGRVIEGALEDHPEPEIRMEAAQPPARPASRFATDLVDRFTGCYLTLGGSFEGLTARLEDVVHRFVRG